MPSGGKQLQVTDVFDLHTHSLKSDGILRPQAVVSRAKQKGVSTLALTDHDTTAGLSEAAAAAAQEGIDFICGIEFSCQWSGVGIHVLGLNFNAGHNSICTAVGRQECAREERAAIIASRLERAGVQGCLQGARYYAGGGSIGRPHFARYLVELGVVPTISMAFKRFLGSGKPGDVKHMWPSIAEAVDWIVAAGGTAVLAHPYKYGLTRARLRRLLQEFSDAGGCAMEVVSGCQQPTVTRQMADLARQFQLYASCGSDFHAPGQGWQELGGFQALPEDCEPVWQLWDQYSSSLLNA